MNTSLIIIILCNNHSRRAAAKPPVTKYAGRLIKFKNIYEYGENVLGFLKSSIANYITVCERFSQYKDEKPTAQLVDNLAGFSYGQLSLMLSMPDEKITEITPDTTCKELRKLKKESVISSELEDSMDADSPDTPSSSNTNVMPPLILFERVLTNRKPANS